MRLDHLLSERKATRCPLASTVYIQHVFFIVLIICFIFIFYYQVNGDLAQLARASALQAEGQGFKSPNLQKTHNQ